MSPESGAGRGAREWIRSLFKRSASTPAPASRPAPLAARVSCRSNVAQVRNPSSDVGPEPVTVPVTGCSVMVELVAPGLDTVAVTGIGAEVTTTTDVDFDGVQVAMARMPDLIGSDDLVESTQRSVASYQPLDPPHFVALLDQSPPIVQVAHDSPQPPIELPLTLLPNDSVTFLVAPVTNDPRLMAWNLLIEWTVDSTRNTIRWPLSVTGDTGYRTALPNGENRPTPIRNIAPDHWSPP